MTHPVRYELTDQEASDIADALGYQAEDLQYRLHQGSDFEPEDEAGVREHIARLHFLINAIQNPR